MINLDKDFKFTVEYTVDENKNWKISYDSDNEELTEDDVDRFMASMLLIKQKRAIAKRMKEEQEKYDKLTKIEKLKYHMKIILKNKKIIIKLCVNFVDVKAN